ncbi:MAG: PIN domain-containing protein [Deltaproteobacteria bacterium]|nr:PIN domain-containing protein [Deltaproteobacteria bacterium]
MVIADTGFWLALANTNDKFHRRAKEALKGLKVPLITTWPVMTETSHLLLGKLGILSALNFIKSWQKNAFQIFDLAEKHRETVYKLMKKYADLPMDLADASLVILAEELEEGLILTTDQRDFLTYRWKSHKPFKNLLLE